MSEIKILGRINFLCVTTRAKQSELRGQEHIYVGQRIRSLIRFVNCSNRC